MNALYESFHEQFELVDATTVELVDEAQALRYQVYCVENIFEDPDQHPGGRERDGFDIRSVHCLVRHRRTGICTGGVRLVLPFGDQPFPIEANCGAVLDRSAIERCAAPRARWAEVSRFSISKTFKRQVAALEGEGANRRAAEACPVPGGSAERQPPYDLFGLMAATVRMSVEQGITHWYAVMEPTLTRLLSRTGIHFQPIGPPVIYHGVRRPMLIGIDDMLADVYHTRPDVWDIMTDRGRLWPRPEYAVEATLVSG